MAHLKRNFAPKSWPIKRKGTKFVVTPNFNAERGIPVLILLRDVLKICQNRKEVKSALHDKNILLNMKEVSDDKNSAVLFDVLTIVPAKKNYRLKLAKNGKFELKEISESDAKKKVAKIVNKKILKGKKVQLNLGDGRNFISDIACNMGDSAIIDFKNRKIEKCLPLKEKSKVFIFAGKHAGKEGILRKLKPERKMASVMDNEEDINVLIKQIMAVE